MTELEKKSLQGQLELANEIIEANNMLLSHIGIAAGNLLYTEKDISNEKVIMFLENLKDSGRINRISSMCEQYINDLSMRKKILQRFKI